MMIVSFSPSTHLVRPMYVPSPHIKTVLYCACNFAHLAQVCWRLFVFLCMYKWKLKSVATAGMILLPLSMHFCLENISGMRNEFVTFCFLFFVQAVRIRQPFLPPAPREIPKGSCIVYVVLHTSAMLTLVCSFVHVQMETQICGNSWYYPPPLTHALLSFACFTLRSGTRVWTCSLISGLLCIFSLLKNNISLRRRPWWSSPSRHPRILSDLCTYPSPHIKTVLYCACNFAHLAHFVHFAQVWEMVSWLHLFRFLCRG